ncbi:MAG: efflux transporter outer membrane subunit [Planctomycetes bacterium]|nr:efflux transporter outer membrane subunit [Planctomycetota bacterium]
MYKMLRQRTKKALLLPDVVICFCLIFAGGCMVGPDYIPYEMEVSKNWSDTARLHGGAEPNMVQWWASFNDPTLTSLVERALKSNLDLKQARSRIRQARAARWSAEGGLWPSADVTGSQSRSRTSTGVKSNLYKTGLDASWEMDIFGGQRRDIEAATADVQAAVEDLRDVWVTLAAEIAVNYIELRGFQQEIVILQRNLDTQKKTAELTRTRFQGGFVGALDVANADALVATTAAQLPPLESSAQQTIHNLGVLLGAEPSALGGELNFTSAVPSAPLRAPVGVPSELLRRRPDIRRAESQIHAATARIGVATADLFPKFTLSGSVGFQSHYADQLVNWNKRIWSMGPSASWNIFDAGRVRANIETRKSLQEQSILTYQSTVLIAMQEVEDAMVALAKEQEHYDALQKAVNFNRKAVELATTLYTQGETDFLNVLSAQRSLYSSEDALVSSRRTISTNLVALYKALGGAWENTAVAEIP